MRHLGSSENWPKPKKTNINKFSLPKSAKRSVDKNSTLLNKEIRIVNVTIVNSLFTRKKELALWLVMVLANQNYF